MTPNERELIQKVADSVRAADRSAIDPDADRFIRVEIGGQANAAYILTQRVVVQDLALARAQSRIDDLEARLRQAGFAPAGAGGGFLGGAGGTTAPAAQPGYPAGGGAAPAAAGGGAGSFLKTAAAAAVGTIGGQLIYDGVRHLAAGSGGLGGLFPRGQAAADAYHPRGADDTAGGGFIPPDRDPGGHDWSRDGVGGGAVMGGDFSGGGDYGVDPGEESEDPEVEEEVDPDDDAEGDTGGGSDW